MNSDNFFTGCYVRTYRAPRLAPDFKAFPMGRHNSIVETPSLTFCSCHKRQGASVDKLQAAKILPLV